MKSLSEATLTSNEQWSRLQNGCAKSLKTEELRRQEEPHKVHHRSGPLNSTLDRHDKIISVQETRTYKYKSLLP